ncbi:efflux RND transporter periplasmic adaptor subunit [Porticoccus sp.]
MKKLLRALGVVAAALAMTGCDVAHEASDHGHGEHGAAAGVELPRGPHGGRLLEDGDFALELAIFETGVPPEFRVWATRDAVPVAPQQVELQITLTRLGGVKDEIAFQPQEDFLRGSAEVYEPHSFVVTAEASHGGETHRWQYDNFEGRTQIGAEVAAAFGLETDIAGPATIRQTVTAYGRVAPNAEQVRAIAARYDGVVESVAVSVGDRVEKGAKLAVVESNDSLTRYAITSPIDGVVTERNAHPGEQTGERTLFAVMNSASLWAEFAVFPRDLPGIKVGAPVTISALDGAVTLVGNISYLAASAGPDQSVIARVELDNPDGSLLPGLFVSGEIQVAEHAVPLAVKRTGLQAFRDFTVVYARVEDQYEVRMLELGRRDAEWVEVLGGLQPGTRYVTTNSYLIKADIEKSGASHDH